MFLESAALLLQKTDEFKQTIKIQYRLLRRKGRDPLYSFLFASNQKEKYFYLYKP